MEKQMTFTREELTAVVKWMEQRKTFLKGERMVIECGDDLAFTNGKWPRRDELQREEFALSTCIQTAKEQLGQADA